MSSGRSVSGRLDEREREKERDQGFSAALLVCDEEQNDDQQHQDDRRR